MIWILGIILVIAAISQVVSFIISGPKYKGPVTDHFDGKTFINPGNVKAKGFLDVLKWGLNREKGSWPPSEGLSYGPPPPQIVNDQLRITFINHSTFLIQTEGLNILTDPVWGERVSPVSWAGPKRHRPAGIKYEDLPPIDVVLITHNHYDHLDMPTMKRIWRDHAPLIITPLGVDLLLKKSNIENIKVTDWWDEVKINDRLSVLSVPAQHFSGRGTFDRDATLWCGFVLKRAKGNVYYVGDTGYGDFFTDIYEKAGPFKVSVIPIGAYKPNWFMSPIHTSPSDAVQIHKDVKSENSIAMHFGTFPLADDGLYDPVNDLYASLEKENVDKSRFVVMKEGDFLIY